MSGVRSGKQVYTTSNQRTTTYTYTTLSGKVMRQQWETRNSDDSVREAMQTLEFVYDDGSQPFAMIYNDGSASAVTDGMSTLTTGVISKYTDDSYILFYDEGVCLFLC